MIEENALQINGGITINVSVKNVMYVKNVMFGSLLNVVVKMENIQQVLWMIQRLFVMKLYMKSNDEGTKTTSINFNEQKATFKMQNCYILLVFSLITIALLIAVSIYYYLIKYQPKQKYLLPFHFTNNQLKEIIS